MHTLLSLRVVAPHARNLINITITTVVAEPKQQPKKQQRQRRQFKLRVASNIDDAHTHTF